MTRLARTFRVVDGLSVVVGIMVGSGIFRTPGLVAAQLGRPSVTFLAWALGGAVGLLGALVFAELATRLPHAGGKYVYAREAYGRRAGFVFGWIETLGIYSAAIAGIATVCGDYLSRLVGGGSPNVLAVALIVALTALNLVGVRAGKWTQNATTAAKVLAFAAIIVAAAFAGRGAGWSGSLPDAPHGAAFWGALAVAAQSVIWTYYGYPDAAKIAEEVEDPERALPKIFLIGILGVTALYLLLNAAFLHVLPFEKIATSTLAGGDAVQAILGSRAGTVMSALAFLVVLGSLNGNLLVIPRVAFGLGRDGLGPGVLARVNTGGTPSAAMLLVGVVSAVLAATGTFEKLLSLAIVFVLLTDGFMVVVLFRLRRRGRSPFQVPSALPVAFAAVYAALFVGAVVKQPAIALGTLAALAAAWVVARYSVTA